MQKINLQVQASLYSGPGELSSKVQELHDAAVAALDQAYAPYSGFQVSAALRLGDGRILTGTNQENAAYPSGLCAERTVLFYAGSAFPHQPVCDLLVLARKAGTSVLLPACPCGGCRQVMVEYEQRQGSPMRVFFRQDETGILGLDSVSALLPFKFDTQFH
jgi:cytidine deaminase